MIFYNAIPLSKFHSYLLEVVCRSNDTQLQVGKNYSYNLLKLRHLQIVMLLSKYFSLKLIVEYRYIPRFSSISTNPDICPATYLRGAHFNISAPYLCGIVYPVKLILNKMQQTILLCKVKRQYWLACKVSRYCLWL